MKKTEKTDSFLQILFPSLSPELEVKTETNTQIDSLRKSRKQFIEGKPLDIKITSLDDFITLAETYEKEYNKDKIYSLDFESLIKMVPSLKKLK